MEDLICCASCSSQNLLTVLSHKDMTVTAVTLLKHVYVASLFVFVNYFEQLHYQGKVRFEYISHGHCEPVFHLRHLSLGRFYKIPKDWGSSWAKLTASRLKIGSIKYKKPFFFPLYTHFHKICWINFKKCWANFRAYGRRGNTAVNHFAAVERG